MLIQRYLKLLAEESVTQPGQVLAITFTKKAAAEIRERVLAQLESAARNEPVKDTPFERETRALAEAVLAKDQGLQWGLLESPQRMNLKTIDSLNALIVTSMPVLSGGGRMSPVEDALPLYQAAARRTVMQLGGEDEALNEALREVLLHRDGNLAECEWLLRDMLERRDQWGELIPLRAAELDDAYLDGTVLPKLERTLETVVRAGLMELAASTPVDFLEQLAALASSLAWLEPYGYDQSPIAVCAGRGIPGTEAECLEHWRALIHLLVTRSSWTWRKGFAKNHLGFEMTRAQRDQLRQVLQQIEHREDLLEAMRRVDKLPPAQYPDEQWRVAKALFRLLSRALVELQLVFAERGECDFAELALQARGALRQEGGLLDLHEALGIEFRHLLVDEMQDTSTIQYELIELLTRIVGRQDPDRLPRRRSTAVHLPLPPGARGALRPHDARTATRRSEADTPAPHRKLPLPAKTGRSIQRRLLPSLHRRCTRYRSRRAPLRSRQCSAQQPLLRRRHRVAYPRHRRQNALARGEDSRHAAGQTTEARQVRAIARKWRSRPLPKGRKDPWKIAVLVQTRRHLVDVVAALKEDDGDGPIPFSAIEITNSPSGRR